MITGGLNATSSLLINLQWVRFPASLNRETKIAWREKKKKLYLSKGRDLPLFGACPCGLEAGDGLNDEDFKWISRENWLLCKMIVGYWHAMVLELPCPLSFILSGMISIDLMSLIFDQLFQESTLRQFGSYSSLLEKSKHTLLALWMFHPCCTVTYCHPKMPPWTWFPPKLHVCSVVISRD